MTIEINKEENTALCSLNPRIYPLETVLSAAYIFLDRAYMLLDGEPVEEIIVELRPMQDENAEKLLREFLNELVRYAVYASHAAKNKEIRAAIHQKALRDMQ
jgi:His-Xaa-Ser system protein HxsD